MIVYLAQDIPAFVMYCVNGESGSSLLIESTNSMIYIYIYIYTVCVFVRVLFYWPVFRGGSRGSSFGSDEPPFSLDQKSKLSLSKQK